MITVPDIIYVLRDQLPILGAPPIPTVHPIEITNGIETKTIEVRAHVTLPLYELTNLKKTIKIAYPAVKNTDFVTICYLKR
jgi:hypothetical protein